MEVRAVRSVLTRAFFGEVAAGDLRLLVLVVDGRSATLGGSLLNDRGTPGDMLIVTLRPRSQLVFRVVVVLDGVEKLRVARQHREDGGAAAVDEVGRGGVRAGEPGETSEFEEYCFLNGKWFVFVRRCSEIQTN